MENLAEFIKTDWRALLGVVESMMDRIKVLEKAVKPKPAKARLNHGAIIDAVCKEFDVHPDTLLSGMRHRHILHARQIGMYLAMELTGASNQTVAQWFARPNHSIVRHACKKVVERMGMDDGLRRRVQALKEGLIG